MRFARIETLSVRLKNYIIMEEPTYNLISIFLGIIALLTSAVAMVVSIVQFSITNKIAEETQRIARMALDIESFRHRNEVIPKLTIACHQSPLPTSLSGFLSIENEGYGSAIIDQITTSDPVSSIKFFSSEQTSFPVTLKYNNVRIFVLWFDRTIADSIRSDLSNTINSNENDLLRATADALMKKTRFDITFRSQSGGKYISHYYYDEKLQHHSGIPREIDETSLIA